MKPIYSIMFVFSLLLVVASIVVLVMFGLNFGVDFRGGSVVELSFSQRPSSENLNTAITSLGEPFTTASLALSGEQGVIVKLPELTEEQHQQLLERIRTTFPQAGLQEQQFESVGPVVGDELKRKSVTGIAVLLAAVMIYIAFVFRAMSRVLSPWAMGVAAIVALAHDILIPLGVFAALGHWRGVEIEAVFVAAVLTILGYSLSDTVVVFDRVRENVIRGGAENFAATVHKSVLQTLIRSLNTTITTLLALVAIYFFGGESVKYFALALIIGIGLGAYSSVFVASPLLAWWSRKR